MHGNDDNLPRLNSLLLSQLAVVPPHVQEAGHGGAGELQEDFVLLPQAVPFITASPVSKRPFGPDSPFPVTIADPSQYFTMPGKYSQATRGADVAVAQTVSSTEHW